ncbi:hypothetical protein JKF63_05673 [Porcisia hertigi]|uniref:Uncharacterized protein n=1 Tax=Porcisia hertigi TaxID=2761500 RepID=A0A836IUF1_9TRYP|nr:hypothetical protein JKF63_05673 [Porcisia hertigi]
MESDDTIITDAARELDHILDVGAGLYLQSIKTPGAPSIRAALGFSLQPLESGRVICLADVSCVTASTAGYVDFPVQVDRHVVAAMRTFFVRSFQGAEGVSSKGSESVNKQRDNLDSRPHVTRAILSGLLPTVVVLAWMCTPQNEIFLPLRRRQLREACFTSEGRGDSHQKLHCVMKEFVLLDLFLSFCPKLKSLWEYRQWLFSNMCDYGFLTDDLKEDSEASLSIRQFEVQDDQLFFVAAHNHPMNYNAWHYRRQRLRTTCGNALIDTTKRDRACTVIEIDSKQVIEFTREHNGDTSATSYLLFLLLELDSLDKKDNSFFFAAEASVKGPQRLSDRLHWSCHEGQLNREKGDKEDKRVIRGHLLVLHAPALWRTLMTLTQVEIRRHSEKGHECIWHLRLGLVQWALTRPPQSRPLSLWTTEDELEWAAAYAGLRETDGVDTLLLPMSTLPHAWTDSFGSFAWTSFNAARYGYQLVSMLRDTAGCVRL